MNYECWGLVIGRWLIGEYGRMADLYNIVSSNGRLILTAILLSNLVLQLQTVMSTCAADHCRASRRFIISI
jgi:hypothetical protein